SNMQEKRGVKSDGKPTIGITMGDPSGIGPEIILKSLFCSEIQSICSPVIYGDAEILNEAKKLTGIKNELKIISVTNLDKNDLSIGNPSVKGGEASILYIREAVKQALEGIIDAIVTAPISKESIHLAGSIYPGHTEMLKDLTGARNVAMMFEGGDFRVVLVTIHCALSEVPKLITQNRVFDAIELTHNSLVELFNIPSPKIVVCGLNPHAGESGIFGNEEIEHIIPAVRKAKDLGIDVTGPLPADTIFYRARQGIWDAVITMYHDQGLIPFKMLSFDDGVNVTLGLPIIRTSPDHGTAFDIAWRGKANPSSMIAAIKVAVNLARNRAPTDKL
ncbi:MAG TPA: 4-hydroxythreonine-4-phosphate dehydrogenase PdxA, partial [Thermodesulfobacteriota bacterium]